VMIPARPSSHDGILSTDAREGPWMH